MKFNKLYHSIVKEGNLAGDGSVFGPGSVTPPGSPMQGDSIYAPGDARVPKVLGIYSRIGRKKIKQRKKRRK